VKVSDAGLKSTHHARGASYEGPEILRIQDRYFVGGSPTLEIFTKLGIDYVHANEWKL
jgi:hypothetical protein